MSDKSEIDEIFAPHKTVIQESGRTVPEIVAQMLNWVIALSNPDIERRREAYKKLGEAFNVYPPTH